ncbi:MAG: leucyl aminopeptidase family protein, partial [Beijerinckiaceae bacterium]|nr:leucyl aminopeptidase family protein [Beijerinckiaceae bacterium]
MLIRLEPYGGAVPLWFVTKETWGKIRAGLPEASQAFASACGFEPAPGRHQLLPNPGGELTGVLFGIEPEDSRVRDLFLPGQLAALLPPGVYRFANSPHDAALGALAWLLSSYRFARYKTNGAELPKLCAPDGVDAARIERIAKGVFLGRDLINTPANDMDPEA